MPNWNAGQYLRYAEERTQPCRDLAARIDVPAPSSVIDLGCGPGNSTAILAARWPSAAITGLDSSPDMLATARRDHPNLDWITGDIAAWAEEASEPAYDIVFSSAALQWLPDHATLFPKLLARARGALVAQMPSAVDAPAQRLIRSLAAGRTTSPVHDWSTQEPAFYYDVLAPHASRVHLWTTDYLHVMDGPESIVEWYRGTGLRPFLEAMPEEAREPFLAEYLQALGPHYPRRADGRILFPFRRLFAIAYR